MGQKIRVTMEVEINTPRYPTNDPDSLFLPEQMWHLLRRTQIDLLERVRKVSMNPDLLLREAMLRNYEEDIRVIESLLETMTVTVVEE